MKQNVKQMFAILHSIIPVYAISLVDLQAALADFLMHEISHSIHLVCLESFQPSYLHIVS